MPVHLSVHIKLLHDSPNFKKDFTKIARTGLVWFDLVLWHINHCRLFNVNSFLYMHVKYLGFGLVWFGFMAYQPLQVIQCQKYIGFGLVWFGLV